MNSLEERELGRIQASIKALSQERELIESSHFRKTALPGLQAMKGRCFIWRNNSYSCPEPHEKWDEYRRLIEVVDAGNYAVMIYQRLSVDYRGRPSLTIDQEFPTTLDKRLSWEPCRLKQFESARRKAFSEFEGAAMTIRIIKAEKAIA